MALRQFYCFILFMVYLPPVYEVRRVNMLLQISCLLTGGCGERVPMVSGLWLHVLSGKGLPPSPVSGSTLSPTPPPSQVQGLLVRCKVAVQVTGTAETGYCFGQLNLYLPMISRWIFHLFQYKQELSLVYQFIDVLYNLQ